VGYDDNVFLQHSGAIGSIYNEFGLSTGVNVGNERTQLAGDLLAGVVAYWQRPGNKIDPDLNLNLTFSHQFSERTVFNLASSASYQAQPDISDLLYPYAECTLALLYRPESTIDWYNRYGLEQPDFTHSEDLARKSHKPKRS
jgi:hypothetical protein